MIIQSIHSNHLDNTIHNDLEDDNTLQLWTPSEFQNHSTEEQDKFVEHLGMSGWSSVFAEAIGRYVIVLSCIPFVCKYVRMHVCPVTIVCW